MQAHIHANHCSLKMCANCSSGEPPSILRGGDGGWCCTLCCQTRRGRGSFIRTGFLPAPFNASEGRFCFFLKPLTVGFARSTSDKYLSFICARLKLCAVSLNRALKKKDIYIISCLLRHNVPHQRWEDSDSFTTGSLIVLLIDFFWSFLLLMTDC